MQGVSEPITFGSRNGWGHRPYLEEPKSHQRDRVPFSDPLEIDGRHAQRSPQLVQVEDDWSDDAPWTERWGRAQSSLPKDGVLGSSLDSGYNMGLLASDSSGPYPDSTLHDARRTANEVQAPFFRSGLYREEPMATEPIEPVTTGAGEAYGSRWRRDRNLEGLLVAGPDPRIRPPPPLPTSPIARAEAPVAPQLVPRGIPGRGGLFEARVEPVTREECHSCGAPYLNDELFCRRCGARRISMVGAGDAERRIHREEALREEAFNALASAPVPPPPLRDARPQRHSGSGATATMAELRGDHPPNLGRQNTTGPCLAVPKLEPRSLPEPPTFLEEPITRADAGRAVSRRAEASGVQAQQARRSESNHASLRRWSSQRQEPVTSQSTPRLSGTSSRPDLLLRATPERYKSSYALNGASPKVERERPQSARGSVERLSEPSGPATARVERAAQTQTFETRQEATSYKQAPRQSLRRLSSCSSVPPARRRNRDGGTNSSTLEAEAEALRKENAILKRRLLAMHEAAVATSHSRPNSPRDNEATLGPIATERSKSPFGRSRASLLQGQKSWPNSSKPQVRPRSKGWSGCRARPER